jgi:hypothetical protein
MDLMKDFLFKKGSEAKVHTPEVLVVKALGDYLSHRGYQAQVEEIEQAWREGRNRRYFTRENLTPEQIEAVDLVKRYEHFDEQNAIKWVLDHPKEIEQATEK